jgi:hypothetical protein
MSTRCQTLWLAGIAAVAMLVASAARADKANLLLMPEDTGSGTLGRSHQVVRRALAVLTEQLNRAGYAVFDERIAAMEFNLPDGAPRSDIELISIARAISRPPIDAIVMVQTRYGAEPTLDGKMRQPDMQLSGRILAVWSGQNLAVNEVRSANMPRLPSRCTDSCEFNQAGDYAQDMAAELGKALTSKLAALPRSPDPECTGFPTAIVVAFEGFTSPEMTRIESVVKESKCFAGLRYIRNSLTFAEYWYERQGNAAMLTGDLRVMFDTMNLSANIQFIDNTLRVTKITTR